MKQTMHIVCLRTTAYSDTRSILTAYSLEAGRLSLLLPAGPGRGASRVRALTQPLGLVDCVVDIMPSREVYTVGQMTAMSPLQAMRCDPAKCAIALFMAEVMTILLRGEGSDPSLWRFVEGAVRGLDAIDPGRSANFHLWFLYRLGEALGIGPDYGSWEAGKVFDISGGEFRVSAPVSGDFVESSKSAVVARLGRMTLENMHLFRFTRAQRNETVDGIMRYLSLHAAPLGGLKTLPVLRALF